MDTSHVWLPPKFKYFPYILLIFCNTTKIFLSLSWVTSGRKVAHTSITKSGVISKSEANNLRISFIGNSPRVFGTYHGFQPNGPQMWGTNGEKWFWHSSCWSVRVQCYSLGNIRSFGPAYIYQCLDFNLSLLVLKKGVCCFVVRNVD